MPDKDPANMSVEEILAACRADDGLESALSDGAAEPEAAAQPLPAAEADSASTEPVSAPPASSKPPGEMSVAEMLAAARAEKTGAGDTEDARAAEPAAAAAPAAPASKPSQDMSVAEMLAAARAEKSAPQAATKPQAAARPKAAPKAAEKPQARPAPADTGPRNTASVLAMARKQVKPGPISKAQAAEQGKSIPKGAGKPKLAVPPMPKRPDFAGKSAVPAESRRGFFGSLAAVCFGSALAIGFSTFSLTNLLWVLGLARYMFPNILTEPPTRFKVGFPDGYGPGQVETKFKAQFGVWIVRADYEGQSQIFALQSVCTHLGCTPNWLEAEQKFKCPCHGSGFYKEGINFEGPAPRPLERFAIKLADDGQLEVDKSQKFQEELGQWQDASSFVPV